MRARPSTLVTAGAALAVAVAVVAFPATAQALPEGATSVGSFDKESMPVRGHAGVGGASTSPITYHGGPVMNASTGVNAYVIWYGSWSGNTGPAIIENFLSNVGPSPYFNINTTYNDGTAAVPNLVRLAGKTTDTGSQGTKLSDSKIKLIVSNAITKGALPNDPTGVYFVLTSKGISESSGFLTRYCGWHTHASIGGKDVKYSFVGDPTGSKISACAAQTASSPNANPGADAMVSVIAHELEEAASDPDLNAWYDGSGAENADKCAWTFGTTYSASNGSLANMTLGGKDYLVQQNWVASTVQACALSY